MWQLGKGGNNHCILTALEARTHYLLQKICSLPKKTPSKCVYFMKMQPEYSVTNKIKQYQIGSKDLQADPDSLIQMNMKDSQ